MSEIPTRRIRLESIGLGMAGWCAITGSYLVSHYVQLASDTPERVVLGASLTWVCALLLLVTMLPICSYCRKIRNDQNSLELVERYISAHAHATFSHGVCPDCRGTVVARELEQWRRAR